MGWLNYQSGNNCTNLDGSYICDCNEGYEFVVTDGDYKNGKCEDIDECGTGVHNCDPIAGKCFNDPGTFYCSCEVGFK